MKPEYATTTTNYASCRWCGIVAGSVPHNIEACPSVKAVEYHPDGSISRVEKWGPVDRQAPVIPLWWFSTHLEAMSQFPLVPANNPYATTETSEAASADEADEDIADAQDVANEEANDEEADGEESGHEEGSDEEDSDEEDSDEEGLEVVTSEDESGEGTTPGSPSQRPEPGPVTFAQVPAAEGLDAVVHKRSDYVAPPNAEPDSE